MKKSLIVILCTCMALSMVACGNTEDVGTANGTVEVQDDTVMGEIEVDFVEPTEAPEVTEAPVEEEVVEPTEVPAEEVVETTATPEPEVTKAPEKEEPVVTPVPAVKRPEDCTTVEEINAASDAYYAIVEAEVNAKYGVNDWTELEYSDDTMFEYIKAIYELDFRMEDYAVAAAKLRGISYMEKGYFGLVDYGPDPAIVPYYDLKLAGNQEYLKERFIAEGEDSIFGNFWIAADEGFETVEEYEYYFRNTKDLLCANAEAYMQLKKEGVIDWRRNID